MNLMNLLENEGGSSSVAKLADKLGIDKSKADELIGSVSPALLGGMQRKAQSTEGRAELENDIQSGKYQRYLDEPDRVGDEAAREEGNSILGHLLGKDESRDVAARASEDTGLDQSLIEKALPIVAGLAMGAVGRKAGEQGSGGPLSALTGLFSGGGDGGFGADDVRNLKNKLF